MPAGPDVILNLLIRPAVRIEGDPDRLRAAQAPRGHGWDILTRDPGASDPGRLARSAQETGGRRQAAGAGEVSLPHEEDICARGATRERRSFSRNFFALFMFSNLGLQKRGQRLGPQCARRRNTISMPGGTSTHSTERWEGESATGCIPEGADCNHKTVGCEILPRRGSDRNPASLSDHHLRWGDRLVLDQTGNLHRPADGRVADSGAVDTPAHQTCQGH